ncbi:MAG: hypothetical protein ABDH49_07050 [Candidatus Hydrothermales bacterium]
MRKIKYVTIVLVIVFALISCKRAEPEFGVEPSRDLLLQQAWEHYDRGEFDVAEFLFDSLITLNLRDREALLGKGYTLVSKKNYDLSSALSYFSLILAIDGISLVEKKFKEVATIITSRSLPYGATWAIRTKKRNIVWVSNVIEAPADVHSPIYFDDTLVYFKGTPPDTITYIDYTYYKPQSSTDDIFSWAWAGIGLIYLAQDKRSLSAEYLYSLVRRSRAFYFPHYPFIKFTNIIGSAAYVYFKEGLYANAVDILKLSGWIDYPEDPFDPTTHLKILLKIEELMND